MGFAREKLQNIAQPLLVGLRLLQVEGQDVDKGYGATV
jgi:hypothetical protein